MIVISRMIAIRTNNETETEHSFENYFVLKIASISPPPLIRWAPKTDTDNHKSKAGFFLLL